MYYVSAVVGLLATVPAYLYMLPTDDDELLHCMVIPVIS